MTYFYIFLSITAIVLASIIGVIFANKKLAKLFNQYNRRFVAFSTGVFLMTVIMILNEVFHHTESKLMAVGLVIAGFLTAIGINYLWPETHQHHDQSCQHYKNKQLAARVIVGDAIHNIGDGIIVVPAFLVSPFLGFVTALSIFTHELLQEISEFFVLKKAGYSTKKALIQNFLASLTIIIGVAIGLIFKDNHLVEIALLAFSSGMLINVIVGDLLPEVYQTKSKKQLIINFLLVGLGVGLLLAIGALAPHSH